MNTQKRSTVVGVFEDRLHANQAVTELHQAGFTGAQIGVAMRHAEGIDDAAGTAHDTHAGSGAMTGALTGLGLGALAGLGVLAGVIPVVGPAIAAGTLGVVLSNAAAGAGIAGLVGALVGAGVPEHEAEGRSGRVRGGARHRDGRRREPRRRGVGHPARNGAHDMSSRAAAAVTN